MLQDLYWSQSNSTNVTSYNRLGQIILNLCFILNVSKLNNHYLSYNAAKNKELKHKIKYCIRTQQYLLEMNLNSKNVVVLDVDFDTVPTIDTYTFTLESVLRYKL